LQIVKACLAGGAGGAGEASGEVAASLFSARAGASTPARLRCPASFERWNLRAPAYCKPEPGWVRSKQDCRYGWMKNGGGVSGAAPSFPGLSRPSGFSNQPFVSSSQIIAP
jgi:hypothetical protein